MCPILRRIKNIKVRLTIRYFSRADNLPAVKFPLTATT